MDSRSQEVVVSTNEIPIVKIKDGNAYVTSNKIIAQIEIESTKGLQRRPLVRTKAGGYMLQ